MNTLGLITNLFFLLVGIVIISGIVIRFMKNHFSKERKEEATLINKSIYVKTIYHKNDAPSYKKEYILTFLIKNRKKNFNVSAFSYINYTIGQKGVIIFKGTRLIDFKGGVL